MNRKLLFSILSLFISLLCFSQTTSLPGGDVYGGVYTSSDPQLAIPVATSGTSELVSTLYFDDFIIDELYFNGLEFGGLIAVEVDINHSQVGDLKLLLESPSGIKKVLSNKNGGEGDDYSGTNFVFDFDNAEFPSITDGTPPFTGGYRPEESTTGMLNDIFGEWKLTIINDNDISTGTLNSWGLRYDEYLRTTYVPDDNFEQYLIDQGYDDVLDDYVLTLNILNIETLNLGYLGIEDLTGIEDFYFLQTLNVFENEITELPLNPYFNPYLQNLNCSSNPLTELNISNFSELVELECYENLESLTTFKVTDNPKLAYLHIANGSGISLDIRNNPSLEKVYATYHDFSSITLSGSTNLIELYISDNDFTSLDIDFPTNTELEILEISGNKLTSLDVSGLEALTSLKAAGNPDLTCIQASQTQIDAYGTVWIKDTTAEFSTNCSISLPGGDIYGGVYTSSDPVLVIPGVANGSSELVSTLFFDDSIIPELYFNGLDFGGLIAVEVDIYHSQVGDLKLMLESPSGIKKVLSNKNGGDGDDYSGTNFVFDFDSSDFPSITNGSPPFTGGYKPEESTLSMLDDIFGEWKLTIINDNDISSGTLNSWGLRYDEYPRSTYVPDDNFEQAMIDLGYDDVLDDYVLTLAIMDINYLNILGLGISDLTGIQDFISLSSLYIQGNQLTDLTILNEFSHPFLVDLNCSNNPLLEFSITNMPRLETLTCGENFENLQSFTITNNPNLKNIHIGGGQATSLDIRNNPSLEVVYASNHNFSSVSLSGSTNLFELYINGNEFTSLDIDFPSNAELEVLDIADNKLTSLDVSGLQALTTLNATNNPKLTCIQVNENQLISTSTNWAKDVTATYSLDCSDIRTYVPDNNFEQALIDLGYDDVLDDYVLTSAISSVETLLIPNRNISDLTGIEDFSSLLKLDASVNALTTVKFGEVTTIVDLNLSQNQLVTLFGTGSMVNLSILNLEFNQLDIVDVFDNYALEELYVGANSLSYLDVSGNQFLWLLSAYDNQLAEMYLNDNEYLIVLDLVGNSISSIDLSTNYGLQIVYLAFNNLSTINLKNQQMIGYLWVSGNGLEELDLTNNLELQNLWADYNLLEEIDLSFNPFLEELDLENNILNSLDLSSNALLTEFNSINNQFLTCIQVNEVQLNAIPSNWTKDVTANYAIDCNKRTYVPDDNFEQALIDLGYDEVLDDYVLTSKIEGIEILNVSERGISDLTGLEDFVSLVELICYTNPLSELSIRNFPYLEKLECFENLESLHSITITDNPNLKTIHIVGGQATSLDIRNNPNLEKVYASYHKFSSISLSGSNSLYELYISDNEFTSLAIDFPSNAELEVLDISSNKLTSLDVSGLEALTTLTATNNLDLTCIQATQSQIDTYGTVWSKDATAEFSTNCSAKPGGDIYGGVYTTSDPRLAIPAANNGTSELVSTLNFDDSIVDELYLLGLEFGGLIAVEVDINHPQVGDLKLILESPSGIKKVLSNKNGGEGDDYSGTNFVFDFDNNDFPFITDGAPPFTDGFRPEESTAGMLDDIFGEWKLTIINDNDISTGTLNSWGLRYEENPRFTYVPDDNFEQYLIDQGYDDVLDDNILTPAIIDIYSLDISGLEISDLTGIQDFINLRELNIQDNQLTDISLINPISHEFLEKLNCSSNAITALNISNFLNLVELECYENDDSLVSFEIINNPKLISFNITGGYATSLNMQNNQSLERVYAGNHQFSKITLSGSSNLFELHIAGNEFTSLEIDFPSNAELEVLDIANNKLTSLDISGLEALTSLKAAGNPNLTCIQTTQLQIDTYGSIWNKDATAEFSTNCEGLWEVYLPDPNLYSAIYAIEGIDTNGDGIISFTEAQNFTGVLDLSNQNISDLTGIMAFSNITTLILSGNKLTNLDTVFNQKRVTLFSKGIKEQKIIKTSFFNSLEILDVSNNELTILNISSFSNLKKLNCSYNLLSVLDVSHNLLLEDLNTESNLLNGLDVSLNNSLSILNTKINLLSCVGVNQNQLETYKNTWLKDASSYYATDCALVDTNDDDNDGVINYLDKCPSTFTGEEVDINGCSESQKDDDNDGVKNDIDTCPDTPTGETVNSTGCALLSSDNFTIEVISETCPNKNNGQLIISAKESRDYKLTINGDEHNFTTEKTLSDLTPGTYEICIEVEGVTSPYCYTVAIEEGTTISGKSNISNKQLQVEVSEGTLPYQVYVNGKLRFETYKNDFSLEVDHGDTIEVKTPVECEGKYSKKVQLFDDLTVYPNPSEGLFTIAIPTNDKKVPIMVFNDISQLVVSSTYEVINSRVQLDLTDKPIGIYLVKINLDKQYVFKVVKE